MKIICSAIVGDPKKAEDLCQSAEKLGAEAELRSGTVYAEFNGKKKAVFKLMELFRQYPYHGYTILG